MQPHPHDRLSGLTGQERSYSARHTRIVRWLRLVLPLLAVAIVAALFTWMSFEEEKTVLTQPDLSQPAEARNELLNPHFESVDAQNRPYTITAARATQSPEDEKLVLLERPEGTIRLNPENSLSLGAREGQYHQQRERLLLEGEVRLTDIQGYEIRSPQVEIDLKGALAWSDAPVQGAGPMGAVEAQGFEIYGDSERLVLKGPAKLTINREAL